MNAHPLRMKDLCERTGLNRQAVHFYIKEGLLPPGHKTSRNMAWYEEAHVERIQLIKKLQHERFLPLDAIKALLDEREEGFDPAQRAFLGQLRTAMRLQRGEGKTAAELAQHSGLQEADVARLAELGMTGLSKDADGQIRVSGEAVPIVAVLGQLRSLGFTDERGFRADDVLIYEEAVTRLLRAEAQLIARGLADLPPDQAAERIQAALPLVHELIARLHEARIQEFLDAF